MTAREFVLETLFGIYGRTPYHDRHHSMWVMSQDTLDYVCETIGGIASKPAKILGRPVYVSPNYSGVTFTRLHRHDRP